MAWLGQPLGPSYVNFLKTQIPSFFASQISENRIKSPLQRLKTMRKIFFIFLSLFGSLLPLQALAASAETPAPTAPAELLIADFESGDLINLLGQESGSWNQNVEDPNDSYTDADVVERVGKDGELNQCLRLNYSLESKLPSQNGFWTKLGGLDASTYDHLEFDVKGDAEKGFTDLFKIELKKPKPQIKGEEVGANETIKGAYRIPVTAEWQTIRIPLNRMTGIINFLDPEAWQNPAIARKDLSEFVVVFHDRMVSKERGTIYLDNIKFIRTGNAGPTAVDFPPQTREKTETKLEGLDFTKYLIGRLGGFPEKTVVKKDFPEDDRAFLMEIAKDTWRFFDEIVDQEHGLVLDTIQVAPEGDAAFAEGAFVGDYTNVTNVGVYLMVLVSAYDLGLITKEDAIARIVLTMNTFEHKLEYHESGFPYNYYDTTLASRTSYFTSLVDSGWLVAGLYVAKNAFKEEVGKQAQRLIDRGNLGFFYDHVERQMFHGFYEHLEVYSDYHYGVFYTEPRATSYIAIARGEVPKEHWFGGMIRTFPKVFQWQTQTPIEQIKKKVLGLEYEGGYYEWKGKKYVPSWGGSGFEALMPTLVLKEKELAPEGLGLNNQRHVDITIDYTLNELGYPVWGMSPSSVPEGGYSEFGVHPLGAKGYKPRVVTPHASVLALEYAPEAVIKNLRKLIELYDIYGEYGFYDAVTVEVDHEKENSKVGLVARKYLALDQGMIFVSINNYLNQGAIRERFHSDPVMKTAEDLLTSEKLFESQGLEVLNEA